MSPPPPALRFSSVDLDRVGLPVLRGVDLEISAGERWAVLGPNGSGKTTLVSLASGYLHPTRGTLDVLGKRLGRTDVRRLRTRIGIVSAAVTRMIEPSVTASEVVLSGRHGALEPWWHAYSDEERERARGLLDHAGFGYVADRPFGVCSEGERQQVLLARALMGRPELLLLDEPAAGLDIAGRERLVRRLSALAGDPSAPTVVLVTHHLEEIPEGFGHAAVLAEGRLVAAGPVGGSLTDDHLSSAFGLSLKVSEHAGRWAARAHGLAAR